MARATGRTWDEWFAVLDASGATDRTHADIARWLVDTHQLTGWWAQAVTVGWERARGRRAVNQKADGFAVSVSATMNAHPDDITAWFTHDALRDRWLEPGLLRIRSVQPGASARFDVMDGETRLGLWMASRPNGRTAIQLQHERLSSADAVEHWRGFWQERLERLAEHLGAAGA